MVVKIRFSPTYFYHFSEIRTQCLNFDIPIFQRFLTHHDLLLWPSFRLSFPELQSGPITNELVFTRPTMTTNSHMTHKIVPVVSDDDHKRHHVVKKNSPRDSRHPSSPTKDPSSPTKHPSSPTKHLHSPTKLPHSPTKHPHSPTKHPHSPTKHSHSQLKSPGTIGEHPPNLHSPTKIKSPTKHHPPGGGHHRPHPHHHTHQHHHHHHKHHSKHDGETGAASSEQATEATTIPGDSAVEHEKSQDENVKKDSSSGKNKTIFRTLQPTIPPKFLLAYVPKVISSS